MASTFTVNMNSQGPLTLPTINRAYMTQDALAAYPISPLAWRVHDAPQTNLPGTSSSDDLGVYGATFATNSLYIATYDVKTLTTTLYARTFLYLPAEYDPGETVTVRLYAGMKTTVASTSATVDVQCYESDGFGGIGSDLCTTSATSINSLTAANKDFTITPTTLAAGDLLDIRVAIAVTDAATGTAVIGAIGAAYLLLDIKG